MSYILWAPVAISAALAVAATSRRAVRLTIVYMIALTLVIWLSLVFDEPGRSIVAQEVSRGTITKEFVRAAHAVSEAAVGAATVLALNTLALAILALRSSRPN